MLAAIATSVLVFSRLALGAPTWARYAAPTLLGGTTPDPPPDLERQNRKRKAREQQAAWREAATKAKIEEEANAPTQPLPQ